MYRFCQYTLIFRIAYRDGRNICYLCLLAPVAEISNVKYIKYQTVRFYEMGDTSTKQFTSIPTPNRIYQKTTTKRFVFIYSFFLLNKASSRPRTDNDMATPPQLCGKPVQELGQPVTGLHPRPRKQTEKPCSEILDY